jgi:hypothetical protein
MGQRSSPPRECLILRRWNVLRRESLMRNSRESWKVNKWKSI